MKPLRKKSIAMMRNIQNVMMTMKVLRSYKMMYYSLFKTNWQYKKLNTTG